MIRRGRTPQSRIRENILELLRALGPSYGYQLYKEYKKRWGKVSIRSIYHHLSKGVELGLIERKGVQRVEGDFSWGPDAQRILYAAADTTIQQK